MTLLTGCTTISDVLYHQESNRFASADELTEDWDKTAPWLPEDATDIKTHESTTGPPAILAATTATALDPTMCAEVTRESSPEFVQSWSPGDTYVDSVWACGEWAVLRTDNGWFGWTPSDPDEQAKSRAG